MPCSLIINLPRWSRAWYVRSETGLYKKRKKKEKKKEKKKKKKRKKKEKRKKKNRCLPSIAGK
ncbi:unnamed protein product [Diplocarpon coronariae]